MRSVTVRLDDLRTMILNLGFVGENEHRTFNFDCKKMFGEYPSASVSLTVQPPAGDCYPTTVERNGDLVSWTVTDSDLIEEGCGEVQLTFMVGDVKAKTCIGRTKVERSLGDTGDIPTPIENWIEQAEEVISEAEAATAAAEDAAEHQPIIDDNGYWAVWDADAEEYVATEYKAQGTDGHDGVGIVSIEKTGTSGLVDTYTITFTSGNHVTYTVTNGRDADPTEIIDDNAGSGDTDKVWSADKSHELLTEINSRYTKPNTGIPASDMAQSVQTSLNNADSAYQKPQTGIPASDMAEGVIPDISGKADKTVTDDLQKNKAPVIIDSAEGNPIALSDGADGLPVEGMKIHFSPKQDTSGGDPSPSHECPISGRDGLTAWRTGKNLLDSSFCVNRTAKGIETTRNADGSITLSGTWGGNRYFNPSDTLGLVLNPGTYTLSEHLRLEETGVGYVQGTFTLTEKRTFTNAYFYGWNTDETVNVKLYPMLNVGDSTSPYAPYTGASYPVTFGQTVYGGYYDAVNGKLVAEWAGVDIGTKSWSLSNNGYFYTRFPDAEISSASVVGNCLCTSYKPATANQITSNIVDDAISMPNNSNQYVRIRDTTYATEEAFEEAISGILFVYKLAEPIEIPLSAISVTTLLGDNVIWSDANGQIDLKYRADTGLFVGGYYKKPETGIPASDLASGVIPTVPAIATSAQIKTGTDSTHPIAPNRQNESIFYGFAKLAGADMASSSNPVGTFTDDAKVKIQKMLGLWTPKFYIKTTPLAADAATIPNTELQFGDVSIDVWEELVIFVYQTDGTQVIATNNYGYFTIRDVVNDGYIPTGAYLNGNNPCELRIRRLPGCIFAICKTGGSNVYTRATPRTENYIDKIRWIALSSSNGMYKAGTTVEAFIHRFI